MVKRGFSIIFLFGVLIFLLGFVSSAASCSITTSCATANTVMKLSSSTSKAGSLDHIQPVFITF